MLSAVAARKTGQAQASVTNVSPISEPTTESDELGDEIRPSAKRKSPEHRRAGDRRKRRKVKKGPAVKASRYFAEQPGLMAGVIESDGKSDSTHDAESGNASEAEDLDHVLCTGRPWSPSVPLHDSSDDNTPEENSPTAISPMQLFPTTFKPLLDRNVYKVVPCSPQEAGGWGTYSPDDPIFSNAVSHQIHEKRPLKIKNFGIWLRYDSRSGTHNMHKEFRELSRADAVKSM